MIRADGPLGNRDRETRDQELICRLSRGAQDAWRPGLGDEMRSGATDPKCHEMEEGMHRKEKTKGEGSFMR